MSNTNSKTAHRVGKRLRIAATVGAVAACCCIFCASSIPGSGLPAGLGLWTSVAHFVEYSCLAAAIAIALSDGRRRFWAIVAIAAIFCSIYGASDELHQWFVPGRNTDVVDWLTDTAGGFFGSWLALSISNALGGLLGKPGNRS